MEEERQEIEQRKQVVAKSILKKRGQQHESSQSSGAVSKKIRINETPIEEHYLSPECYELSEESVEFEEQKMMD